MIIAYLLQEPLLLSIALAGLAAVDAVGFPGIPLLVDRRSGTPALRGEPPGPFVHGIAEV